MTDGRRKTVQWDREFETIALRRQEAAENFTSGGPGAAAACGDLADRLREAGRLSDAEALYREALGLWRKLALGRPGTWLPLLAEACGDLADLLSETGQAGEALSLSREALELWRGLEKADPSRRPDLAENCGALADLLSDAGQAEEAEALARESLGLWKTLALEGRGWKAELADASRFLADLLSSADGGIPSGPLADAVSPAPVSARNTGSRRDGRAKEAERLYCEALDLYRELSKRIPRYGADAVLVCNNLGTLLCGQGRREAGEWFYRQALDLHRKQPDRTDSIPFAASACGNLAGSLEARLPGEAERLYRAALDAWRKLGGAEEGRYVRETADASFRLASFLYNVRGDGDEAERLMRQAVSLLRREPRYAEAAAHIRRVMAEWGLADPIIELPAALPETVIPASLTGTVIPAVLPETAAPAVLPGTSLFSTLPEEGAVSPAEAAARTMAKAKTTAKKEPPAARCGKSGKSCSRRMRKPGNLPRRDSTHGNRRGNRPGRRDRPAKRWARPKKKQGRTPHTDAP